MKPLNEIWAIVPAAGIGKRMQSTVPKQYLTIQGKSILELSLQKLSLIPQIKGIIVAVSPNDSHFPSLKNLPKNVVCIEGGKERADSVFNGLKYLKTNGHEQQWVMVHDAARPCVKVSHIQALIQLVDSKQQGAILAVPVADTLKRAENGTITETVNRSQLWLAHTPQLFPMTQLYNAMTTAMDDGIEITDEASAIEHVGGHPLILADSRDNIKITQPEDLALAEFILQSPQP